jgi:D-arabinose 1-dehydrogenase-like Zn-dependent alcohol dehydrogenase
MRVRSDYPEPDDLIMIGAVLRSYNSPLEFEERPALEPGLDEVVVQVAACGVCGSDTFLQKGGFDSTMPIIPGHEAAGLISRVGRDVVGIREGDPVAIYYIDHCGECALCRAGRVNMCLSVRRMGVDFDGAFASEVLVPARNVVPVEPTDDLAAVAVLTDAVATPYHGLVRVAKVSPGSLVVVFGIGGIGSNAVQIAAHLGCDVIAVSRSEEKLSLARELGATMTVRSDDDVVEALRAVTGPKGPDVVVQTVGSALVDQQAFASVGVGGKLVLIGASMDSFSLRATDLIWKESTIHGSRGFVPDDIVEVLDLHRAGKIRTDHMTDAKRPLAEANDALDDLRGGQVLRTILLPNG